MERIDSDTVDEDLFGAGKDGFTGGVPGQVPPTRLTPEWCNNVQEEICGLIEDEGGTVGGSYTQLAEAVAKRASGVTPEKNGGTPGRVYRRTHAATTTARGEVEVGEATSAKAGAATSASHQIDTDHDMPNGIYKCVVTVIMAKVGDAGTFYWREFYVPYAVVGGSATAYTAQNSYFHNQNSAPFSSATFAGTGAKFRVTVTLSAGAGTYNIGVIWRYERVTITA